MVMDPKSHTAAFEELYQRMHTSVYRFVRTRVSDHAEAEDLTSQTFLQAMPWYDETRSQGESRSWIFQIARNVMGDHWRKRYRYGPLIPLTDELVARRLDEQVGTERSNTNTEIRARTVLERLPDRYRRVLELRFLQGASLKETADALTITVANAKVLQYRALRRAAELDVPPESSGNEYLRLAS